MTQAECPGYRLVLRWSSWRSFDVWVVSGRRYGRPYNLDAREARKESQKNIKILTEPLGTPQSASRPGRGVAHPPAPATAQVESNNISPLGPVPVSKTNPGPFLNCMPATTSV